MVRLFKHYIPYAVILLCIVDFALLVLANELSWRLRAMQIGMDMGSLLARMAAHGAFGTVMILAMVSVGVYASEALRSMRFAAARLLVAVSLGVIALAFVDFVVASEQFWRSTLVYSMGLAIVLLMGNRLFFHAAFGSAVFRRRVLVLGSGARARRIEVLSRRPESGFAVAGFVDMNEGAPCVEGATPRAEIENLTRFVESLGVSEVVLALQERRNAMPVKDLLRIKTAGVHVNDFSSLVERETGRIDLDTVNPSWLIFSDGFSSGRAVSGAVKRLFDIVASSCVLLLTGPVVLVFAVLVKLDSKGPAFYRQSRVGLFGVPFDVIKLRSMRSDAEVAGAQWATKDDPRITRLGRVLRKLRIDELPQAWTVLKGEMSFVGPRPERPEFVADLEAHIPFFAERHMVKPGITGWAQINHPYGASVEDSRNKLEYDLYYAKNYTPFLDLLILLQTLRVVIWSEGAR